MGLVLVPTHRFVDRGCRAIERLFALTALDTRLEMVSSPLAALQPSPA